MGDTIILTRRCCGGTCSGTGSVSPEQVVGVLLLLSPPPGNAAATGYTLAHSLGVLSVEEEGEEEAVAEDEEEEARPRRLPLPQRMP
jgi:hypothetical protein